MRISDWSSDVCSSDLIAVNQDPYRHQITLNRGSRDGVYRGQALVDAYGIMGQIVDVAPNTCKALLVTDPDHRSEEHTSELQSLMRISYAVFCLKKKTTQK